MLAFTTSVQTTSSALAAASGLASPTHCLCLCAARRWPKTVLVVSHAREFLNCVCTDIIHLHSRTLTCYKGDYTTFERTMNERVRNANKAAEAQETKRKHVQVGGAVVHSSWCTAAGAQQVVVVGVGHSSWWW